MATMFMMVEGKDAHFNLDCKSWWGHSIVIFRTFRNYEKYKIDNVW
jgi:hypothetical protein